MSCTSQSERQWFAVRIRTRWESLSSELLRSEGLEVFLPLYESKRRWSDRVKAVKTPLFPGYLFCKFAWNCRRPVIMTTGVIEIVGFGEQPTPVDPVEIESLKVMVASGVRLCELKYFEPNTRVLIESGPLAGVEGSVISVNNRQNLIVSVTLLRRSVAAEINPEWVRRITPRASLAATR